MKKKEKVYICLAIASLFIVPKIVFAIATPKNKMEDSLQKQEEFRIKYDLDPEILKKPPVEEFKGW